MPDWTWLLLAAFLGAVSALAVPLALLFYYFRSFNFKPRNMDETPTTPYLTLSPEILNELTRGAGGTPEGVLNAMLQFIFQQSTADTRWLRRRMANELAELLAKTSSGKIFESLTLRSLEVGSEFPSINNLRLLSGELEEDGARLRSLDLRFDLAYDGNFRIEVDAVMLLGKIANISITVESISGSVRLMFRRTPYTHWALAFESPPKLELRVRGRFQGRQLKPRLAALVAAHIRRAVAQRHTLPNYKIRYKPFFPKSEPGSTDGEDGPTPHGRLTVRLVEVTRLHWSGGPGIVRAALAVDSHGWVSLRRGVLVLDIVLPAVTGPLGLVCCQGVGVVLVDTVVPMSPAYRADLRRDDVVLAIDNKPVNNVAQVGKLLRSVERRAVTVRVRRGGAGGAARRDDEPRRLRTNFSFRRVSEVMEGVRLQGMRSAVSKNNLQESDSPSKTIEQPSETDTPTKQKTEPVRQLSKTSEPVGPGANFGLRKRRCSVENKSSDSSAGSTPPASGASTPLRQATVINKTVKHPDIPIIRTDSTECKVSEKLDNGVDDDDQLFETGGPRQSEHVEICQMFWTKSLLVKPIIPFDEETDFKLNENHKYLNINVWATVPGEKEEVLLGYLNIPLAALLTECQDSTVPHHMKRYQFLPPDVDIKFSKSHKLASHAGFEPCLCFGDALVWWEWEGAGGARSAPRAARGPAPPRTQKPVRAAHDFVRTHFHRSTQCDFCNKKIWLKDAMQCRNCGLCCHKKCVTKCQETSPCVPRQDRDPSGLSCQPPELIMTEPDSIVDPDSDDDEKLERKDSLDVHEEAVPINGLVNVVFKDNGVRCVIGRQCNTLLDSYRASCTRRGRRERADGGLAPRRLRALARRSQDQRLIQIPTPVTEPYAQEAVAGVGQPVRRVRRHVAGEGRHERAAAAGAELRAAARRAPSGRPGVRS
ncbi:PDZ domain-containing protein 8 isoform X2 [Epargyreus clarus]|uniref:PDZ domain-containing protein 8 isoform X2 n=1 Tax=Epargyreus clarus TaxID=520877 RepID=UPI003C2C1262